MSDSRRTTLVLAFAAMLLSPPPPARAQGAFPPASFTNLQVLPPTTTPADLMAIMKGAAQGLGVRCQHCHIGEEGQPLAQFDFVSDQKPRSRWHVPCCASWRPSTAHSRGMSGRRPRRG